MLATWFGEAASTIDAWFDAPNSRCGGPPFKILAPPVELKKFLLALLEVVPTNSIQPRRGTRIHNGRSNDITKGCRSAPNSSFSSFGTFKFAKQ